MISPFKNDSESMQIGELVIENQQDKVIVYGDIDIYRTEKGLEQAQQLQELFAKIVQALTTASTETKGSETLTQSSVSEGEKQADNDEDSDLTDNPFL